MLRSDTPSFDDFCRLDDDRKFMLYQDAISTIFLYTDLMDTVLDTSFETVEDLQMSVREKFIEFLKQECFHDRQPD